MRPFQSGIPGDIGKVFRDSWPPQHEAKGETRDPTEGQNLFPAIRNTAPQAGLFVR